MLNIGEVPISSLTGFAANLSRETLVCIRKTAAHYHVDCVLSPVVGSKS
jgi:hypothetical protein